MPARSSIKKKARDIVQPLNLQISSPLFKLPLEVRIMIWKFLLLQYKHTSPYSGDSKGLLNYWTAGGSFSTAFFLTCKRIAAETTPLIFKELPLLREGAKILCPWAARRSLKDRVIAKLCQTIVRSIIPNKIVSRWRRSQSIPISTVNASFVTAIALTNSTKFENSELRSKDWDDLFFLFPNLQSMTWHAHCFRGKETTTLKLRILDLANGNCITIDSRMLIMGIRKMAYDNVHHPSRDVNLLGPWLTVCKILDESRNTNPQGMARMERILDTRVLKGCGTVFTEKICYLEAIEEKFSYAGEEAEDFNYHACTSSRCAAGDRRGCPL